MSARPTTAVRSMTGYGRATAQAVGVRVSVELRSTNHRYLEIDQRLPNGLSQLQSRIGELIRSSVRRGRVEVSVSVQLDQREQRRLIFDEPLLQRYHSALLDLKTRFGLKGPVTLDHLLALPQAVTVLEDRVPTERLWEPIRAAVTAAARDLVSSRRREGGKLSVDLARQIRAIRQNLRTIQRRLPKALEQQRAHLRERLQGLLGAASTGSVTQLEQAAALVKDADIHEELVRLDSHLAHMRQALRSGQPVGKQLDFIAQELMREANTMGAKVNDPQAGQRVVEIKGCIEKIREQVQNLE